MGDLDFSFFSQYKSLFFNGVIMTVELAFFTVIIGSILGTIIALMRLSRAKILKFIASVYVEFLRGTPLLVQVYIVFYGVPALFPKQDFSNYSFLPAVIALSINSGAYIAEIMRSGIQSIDKGQTEAARSLGMGNGITMKSIILPQALKNILPALGNEFITVIKESSIVSIVGISELMYNTDIVKSNTARPFEPLIIAALMYFVLTFSLSKLLGVAERKMKKSDAR